MRILIDLQGCQTESRSQWVGDCTRRLATAIVRNQSGHEVWLLLNEALPQAAREIRAEFEGLIPRARIHTFAPPGPVADDDPANAWRRRAAERIREHCISNLEADVVVVPSLFEGFRDDGVVSIGNLELAACTTVLLHDLNPMCEPDVLLVDRRYRAFYYRKLQSLKRADCILTTSEEVRAEALDLLSVHEDRVLALTENGFKEDDGARTFDAAATRVLEKLETMVDHRQNKLLQSVPIVGAARPRLAYVSPLPPERTGIADYSAELIPELSRFYDIDLITDQTEMSDPWLAANFRIRGVAWFDANADQYDRVLYHIGNSAFHSHMPFCLERHPGVIVFHDFFLGHLIAQEPAWLNCAVYESHGYPALVRLGEADWEPVAWEYPCNKRVLNASAGVVVHRHFSKELAEYWYGPESTRYWAQVPHLHAIPRLIASDGARQCLEVGDDSFVVCAFGMLGPTKLNHRLLDAWHESDLSSDRDCYLVFVGERQCGEYGRQVTELIHNSPTSQRIRTTGFVPREEYNQWLAVADVAVQLRTLSRGESSGAILDCLASGIPLIFNAHAAAAEVPDNVGVKLPDEFSNAELASALNRLKDSLDLRKRLQKAAVSYVSTNHHPEHVGRCYRDAIERFWIAAPRQRERRLVRSLTDIATDTRPSEADLAQASIAITYARQNPQRQLLVDISAIARHDLRTGIQRVVRAQLRELLTRPPKGYRVEPVYLTQIDGVWQYHYAREYTLDLLGVAAIVLQDGPAEIRAGDIFLGLDWYGGGVVEAEAAGLYQRWRARGVCIGFTVYDLLPVSRPEWFPNGADDNHEKWLHAIAQHADLLVCISKSVADELENWISRQGINRPDTLVVQSVHLGADIESSVNTRGRPQEALRLLVRVRSRHTFLMVGTIEPRKGYIQALDAFDILWAQGEDLNLAIVGQSGWKHLPDNERRNIPSIVSRLDRHPELGQRLFWLDGISDEFLEDIYSASTCLLVTSEAEGFGLPLIEAAQRDLPIIARDIPVFKEVAGGHAYYFNGKEPTDLADAIKTWHDLYERGEHPASNDMPWLTWRDSTERLKEILTVDAGRRYEVGPSHLRP